MNRLAIVALAAFCAVSPAFAGMFDIDENDLRIPQEERQFSDIFRGAQSRMDRPNSAAGRSTVRLEMQMHTQKFMNPVRVMQKWIGVVEQAHRNDDGTMWVRIAIPGDIVLSTEKSRSDDPDAVTLIRPTSRFYPVMGGFA
jgi:hypothetical protein